MKINENKVKEVLERVLKDLDSASVQSVNNRWADDYIKQSKARITTLIDMIDWE